MTPRADSSLPRLFNSPLETGFRSVVLLVANYPKVFSLDRIVALDHLVVHSGDIGGPPSLHPDTPMRATEMIVRRGVVERGLLLMESRGLVKRAFASDGIFYGADETAAEFVSWFSTPYATRLKRAADFLSKLIVQIGDDAFEQTVSQQFERWALEFQPIEGTGSAA